MRRRHLILFLVGMLSLAAAAQPRLRTPELYVGAHGGIMGSMMIFNPTVKGLDLRNTFLSANGGLVFRYAGHKVCGIQVEINYMQRGWREVDETKGIDYTRQLDYIEVPMLMHLYFGGQRGRGFVNLGPQIGYGIRDVARGTPQEYIGRCGAVKKFDYGFALGVGGYFRSKKAGLFQLEARGNYSLGGTFSTKQVDYFATASAVNVSVNVAYLWEIKVK